VTAAGREALASEPWASEVELAEHALLGRAGTRALAELTLVGRLASRDRLEVLHGIGLIAPLWLSPASVVTIADVTWIRQPEHAERWTARLWRVVVPPGARRAERVIAISEAAREEIVEDLRVAPERIDVIPLGPGSHIGEAMDERELRDRLGLGDARVVLAVSALKAHKNLPPLVEAMVALRRTHPDAVLVIPGNPTPRQRELQALAGSLGDADAVRFPGWVSGAELEGLYGVATAFAFPSLREGFGLPVLEAMRRGLPVACSNSSAVPEVAGHAALYFDPGRPEEIRSALERLLDDGALRAELSERGRRRAEEFTWQRTARETLSTYDRAAAGR
jgi:glycosyltransferase involved in cell wall biosynthesis